MITEENFRSRLKYFIPVWLFPFIFIYAAINEELNGSEEILVTEKVALIAFVVCNIPMMRGWIKGLIPAKEMIVFWWLLPFLLWIVLVFIKVKIYG